MGHVAAGSAVSRVAVGLVWSGPDPCQSRLGWSRPPVSPDRGLDQVGPDPGPWTGPRRII